VKIASDNAFVFPPRERERERERERGGKGREEKRRPAFDKAGSARGNLRNLRKYSRRVLS